jgi:hypothetical protein
MFKNRLVSVLVAIALIVVVALTIQEVFATANIVSHGNSTKGTKGSECASLPSRYSIRPEVVKETGTRLTYTEVGPTGIDGGLIDLYSKYRTCSTK